MEKYAIIYIVRNKKWSEGNGKYESRFGIKGKSRSAARIRSQIYISPVNINYPYELAIYNLYKLTK